MPNTRVSKNPGVVKGRLPLKLYSGSDGMYVRTDETFRFSYLAGFAARELMREAKPVKTRKVAFGHFFDTLRTCLYQVLFTAKECVGRDKRLPT